MNKVGIISLYFKNHNYGGLLQAYALTRFLNEHGIEAEQISWDFMDGLKRNRSKFFKNRSLNKIAKKTVIDTINLLNAHNLKRRTDAFEKFERTIPHSNKVYTYNNIKETLSQYSCFITGSDQVWNISKYNPEQFLCFVPETKVKVSYAASMPDLNITDCQKKIVSNHLNKLDAVSVRENITAQYLSKLTQKKVEWVLDPTLLLSDTEWNTVAKPYNIKSEYIFCYFLGGRRDIRRIADIFAKKIGMKIATFSHLGCINISDTAFGHYKIYDATPNEFLSLIRNAKYVLTDSFHATIFSYIFGTRFYVFSRAGQENTDSRITSLLEIFDETKRFCIGEKFNANYLYSIRDKVVSKNNETFIQMKKRSETFLLENVSIKKPRKAVK